MTSPVTPRSLTCMTWRASPAEDVPSLLRHQRRLHNHKSGDRLVIRGFDMKEVLVGVLHYALVAWAS
eukprot:CAMPEP_0198126324 /NCGR_PEP_ID=MMETSP1442-20131203/44560_1 /TAXON_ID= /ORGANISM="Craspedostauros australis, Strain CCMP3328" /LENGTH=66 /DNA_ID=CAMNT_0043786085 /DNA_START=28 /DNA_END=228 /DNA_ORIENTATION=+